MDENVMKKIRRAANGSTVAAAVCALVGAIGGLVTMNLLIAGDIDSAEGGTVCSILCITFWDLARLGGFGIFVGGLISVALEIFGRDRNKAYSFILLGGSVFGFIGSIMLSIQSIVKSAMEPAQRYDYNYGYGYGSSYSQADAIISSLTSNVTTACVFIIVSAVVAFIAVGIAAAASNNAYTYGYAQMPNAAGMNAGADGAWYCPNCGAPNSGSSVICKNCGKYK